MVAVEVGVAEEGWGWGGLVVWFRGPPLRKFDVIRLKNFAFAHNFGLLSLHYL